MKYLKWTCLLPMLVVPSAYAGDIDASIEDVERTDVAREADRAFWDLMHGKDYQRFDIVVAKLTEARATDPTDVYTNAHIGWTNFWAVSEGIAWGVADGRKAVVYMQAAENAYAQAALLAPDEPRILGFLGYSRLALGGMTQNIELILQGQADVARSIALWPEWAYFGAAYGLDGSSPYDTPQFQQALAYYWANMDACANAPVDRQYPDWSAYLQLKTLDGPDRACWNSWIAPYNIEGFFLVMGDALVKAGNTEVASILYNNAKLIENYATWPFRDLLERRISNIMSNVENFRQIILPGQPADPETSSLVNTNISCAICHRGDADTEFEPPKWVGEDANLYPVPFR